MKEVHVCNLSKLPHCIYKVPCQNINFCGNRLVDSNELANIDEKLFTSDQINLKNLLTCTHRVEATLSDYANQLLENDTSKPIVSISAKSIKTNVNESLYRCCLSAPATCGNLKTIQNITFCDWSDEELDRMMCDTSWNENQSIRQSKTIKNCTYRKLSKITRVDSSLDYEYDNRVKRRKKLKNT